MQILHVDPSDVRNQKGQFGKAFAKHNNNNKVESWKKALFDASSITGWEPNQVANGHEAKCIKEIVGSILDKLSSLDSAEVEDEDLVGMGTRLKDLKQLLRIGSGGVRMVGTLARLKDLPEMNILEKLKISHHGLQPEEKELFLDIACFYRWESKNGAMEMLDARGFHPRIGVKVLIQKALISVSKDGKFDMHHLVQEMAHYIVRGKHPNNPEKHSRLWRKEDIEDVCSRNATAENDEIEANAIQYCYADGFSSFNMLVSNMKKLRFLHVRTLRNYDEGPRFLSNELRYINWEGYPASPFPESFQPRKLVVIKMWESVQRELWKGYKYLPSLKVLQLSNMKALVRTPDIGGLRCLQKLILHRCESLEKIHQSLGNHASLVSVDVSFCHKLTRFPRIVGMEKLEIIRISECKALVEFPKIEANMDNLAELKLKVDSPRFLRKLNLRGCGLKDGEIPCEVGELSNLQELNLNGNDFTRLDFSLSQLIRLKLLYLSCCGNLVELPELPSSLAILKADECHALEEVIRDEIHRNCKWLSQVSITGGWRKKKNIVGGERLLEIMLQGNAGVESGCLSLHLQGSEIPRVPRVVRGKRCRMQLPDNWYNHFSGFLICVVSNNYHWKNGSRITMKHEEKSGLMGMGDDSQHDLYWESGDDKSNNYTWMGYISFGLLRNTLWWNHTSTSIQMEIIHIMLILGADLSWFKWKPPPIPPPLKSLLMMMIIIIILNSRLNMIPSLS